MVADQICGSISSFRIYFYSNFRSFLRPQIESAPPSVTTNPGGPSPCSLSLGSGPSSSASYSGGEPFAHHQLPPYMMMVSAAPPPPPQFAAVKADSLSPIKRSSTARGSRAAKNAAKMNGLTAISPSLESVTTAAPPSVTVAPPAGSSVDALANTIAYLFFTKKGQNMTIQKLIFLF